MIPGPVTAAGPLRPDPSGRYFQDADGNTILLTGSHTWNSLVDQSHKGTFDYAGYLSFLQQHGHNFIRMWTWEHAEVPRAEGERIVFDPSPFQRPGPGLALDGKPKFDLTKFNQAYFDRLRSRVIDAGNRGMYVSVMLFEGWSIAGFDNVAGDTATLSAWEGHPFHPDNNINGIDADLNGDGKGYEVHSLLVPDALAVQEAYVRKVVDTLNDLDNVLYEIANESWGGSWEWQYHMIQLIKDYEAGKPKQHPVGMTVCGNGPGWENRWAPPSTLFDSPADWISPASDSAWGDYKDAPPVASGRKVVLTDTDHLWGVGGDRSWVWKSFCRGLNPIYMDPMDDDPAREDPRNAMGHVLSYAQRMDLSALTPTSDGADCSTTYCLRNPGVEYLVYQPGSGSFSLTLEAGTYSVEWFRPAEGTAETAGTITVEGGPHTFTPPFSGDAVLYLKVQTSGEEDPRPGRIGGENAQVPSHPSFDVAVDPVRNLIHFVYSQTHSSAVNVYYVRSADGGETWSEPERMPGNGKETRIAVDSSGTLHMVYATNSKNLFDESEVWYRTRSLDGRWSDPIAIQGLPEPDGQSFAVMGPRIAVDLQDNVHVIAWKWCNNITTWPDYLHRMRCIYTRKQAGQAQFDPVQEFAFLKDRPDLGGGSHGDLAVDPTTGDLHIVYAGFSRRYHSSIRNGWRLNHLVRHPDGTWADTVDLWDGGTTDYGIAIDVDARGTVHLASFHQPDPDADRPPKYWAYYNNAASPSRLDLIRYEPDDWSIVVGLEEVNGSIFLSRVNVNGQNIDPWRASYMWYDAANAQWNGPAALSPSGYRNGGYRHGSAPKFAEIGDRVVMFYAEQAPGESFKFFQKVLQQDDSPPPPENAAPSVEAGADLSASLPDPVALQGSVEDDGLPVDGTLTVSWTVSSGPGPVSFDDPNSAQTTAAFDTPGEYVLTLRASDGELTSEDSLTVTAEAPNEPPVVEASGDLLIVLHSPGTGELHGVVNDDGRPEGGVLEITWSVAAGPGPVTFGDPHALDTTATFTVPGDYELVLTASDGEFTSSDSLFVTVIQGNDPPEVDAGPDLSIVLPETADLHGTVADDGLPEGSALVVTWSVVSGPGTVTFGDPHALDTTAAFTDPGSYELRLSASDGEFESADTLLVQAAETPQADPPSIEPAPGAYTNEVEVILSTATPGATIRYTTDGTDPSGESALYEGPFLLTESATVRAVAIADGYLDSAPASASYVIELADDPGEPGGALYFDGQDDVVEISSIQGAPAAFSVEFWIRPSSRKNWNQDIMAGPWGTFIFHTTSDGAVYAGTDLRSRFTPNHLPAGTIQTGEWQHVVYVFDHGYARFFRNGRLLAAKTQRYPEPWTHFALGKVGSDYDVDGALDEVRLYSRALSPDEVVSHYNDGRGTQGEPEPGLWAGWHLDETEGTIAHDYSGNGHHGVLLNGPAWGPGIVGATLAEEEPPVPTDPPEIVPAGGTFTNEVQVALQAPAADATVYYTTDGSDPSAECAVYGGPFVLAESAEIRAIALRPGYVESETVSATFEILPGGDEEPPPPTGSALLFDGEDDIVEIPTITGSMEAFSIEFWMHPASCGNWSQNIVADGGWGQFVFHTTSDGALYVGTDLRTRFTPSNLPPGTLQLGVWQHFAYVFDHGQAFLYRNGVLLASRSQRYPEPWTGFRFGLPSSQYSLDGRLDEVRIYSRALSAEEIAAAYADGVGQCGEPEPGLLAGWHLDEGSGNTIVDYSGNGHHGILLNGTSWAEGLVPADAGDPLVVPTFDPSQYVSRTSPEDVDGDGLPDAWEQEIIAAANDPLMRTLLEVRPVDDADLDGLSNFGEYAAGTNPIDPASVLAILATGLEPDGRIFVEFPVVAGRTYTIWKVQDGSDWTAADSVTAATDGVHRWIAPAADSARRGFYAVSVP